MRGKNRDKTYFIVTLILLILAELFLLNFVNTFVDLQINSDHSSELVLSHLLAKQKRIISPDWYYSTEIRFLNTNLIYTPLFWITQNWHTVRVWAVAIMQAILILSVFLLCRSCHHTESFPVAALAMILPLSEGYYDIVLKGAFYIPYIVISFLGLALVLETIHVQEKKWKEYLFLGLSFLLAILSCVGGPRQVIVLYLPLFLCILIISARQIKQEGFKKFRQTKYFSLLSCGTINIFGAGIGYLVNMLYLSRHYSFVHWGFITFADFDWNRFISVINGFLTTYGYNTGAVFSACTFSNFVAMVLFVGTIFGLVYPLKHRDKVSFEYFFLASFYIADVAVFILLYSFTSMAYATRYNEPIIVLSYVLIAIAIRESGWLDKKQIAMGSAYALILLVGGGLVYHYMLVSFKQSGYQNEKADMAHVITEQGYYTGYASYWNANVMTELSNGALDMYDWLDSGDGSPMKKLTNINQTNHWLQLVSHDTERPKGKIFILLSTNELKKSFWRPNLTDDDLIYSSKNFKVYGYDNYDAMIHKIGNYSFKFGDNRFSKNCHDEGDVRILDKKGVSFGPEMEFYKGDYQVTIKGNGLDRASRVVTYDRGKRQIPVKNEKDSEELVEYTFHCDEDHTNGEIVIKNDSAQDVEIDSIKIERMD